MTPKDATHAGSAAEAPRWFVRVDAGERGATDELAAWLVERPENERALERVELAVALGKRLAAEPGSALCAQAAEAVRPPPRRIRRSLAWASALAAAALVVVALWPNSMPPADAPQLVPLRAAELAAIAAPNSSVAVLPTGVVVDASTVAVLPFAYSGDGTLAAGLERDVVAALRGVPGLYVIADDVVQPYAATELDASELGGQLGARGIVDAAVELAGGRVRVSAQLRDAATGATLWRTDLDRSVDELRAIRYEIADNVAATMFDSGLREQAARPASSSTPVSVGKPLPQ